MKYAVSSYSFQQYINTNKLDQFQCIEKAKEMGFDAIEFTDLIIPSGEDEISFAKALRKECDKNDICVSNYTISGDLLNGGKEEIERLKHKVDIANILGAKSMRHDVAMGFADTNPRNKRGLLNVIDELACGCRTVTEYAEKYQIKTMVENHSFFLQDADRVERLINTVNHPNFGWLCDIGNFLCVDENPALACGKAAPYISYVHVKDFIVKDGSGPNPGYGFFTSRAKNYLRGTIVGQGSVPIMQCLSIIKDSGYDSYIGLEFEGIEDCLLGIKVGLENIKKYLSVL